MKPCLVVLLLCSIAYAKDDNFISGKLVDVRHYSSSSIQGEYCMAVQLEGISYLMHYVPFFRGSYVPTDLIVGDPIQVRVQGGDMVFLAKGKKQMAKILGRERSAIPITCADQVQVRE